MSGKKSVRDRTAIAIFGAGGLGREVLHVARELGRSCVGFIVDPGFDSPSTVHGLDVHRSATELSVDPALQFVVAIGNPDLRSAVVSRLEREVGRRFATIIHQRAWICEGVPVGEGSIIFGPCSVSADARVGKHVVINPGVTVAHDCELSDFATLGPSCALAGGVRIGDKAELGVGVKIAPRVSVGKGAMVGAGAVCIRTVDAGTTVVGVPARILKPR